MFVFHLVRVHFSLVQFRQHSFWFICASLLLLAHDCHSLAFVCTHSCLSVFSCWYVFIFFAFSFTLICSYLYTDLLSPIGFFFICTHLCRPPAHQLLFVHIRTHLYSFSPVLVCARSCSPALFVLFCLWSGVHCAVGGRPWGGKNNEGEYGGFIGLYVHIFRR